MLLILRGWDVRLVLLAAAWVLGTAVGDGARIIRTFLATLADEKFVVPICSAMGFAYVLRYTGCDQQLVQLLLRPLRRCRGLLIPGVIVTAFVVNISVISQASTAACVGPVAIPLLRAAGYSPATAGASVLLGASVGGELLNPGAPELLTIAVANPDHPKAAPTEQVRSSLAPVVLTQLGVVVLVYWLQCCLWQKRAALAEPLPQEQFVCSAVSPRPLAALVPVLPPAVLILSGPPLACIHIPEHWVIPERSDGVRDPTYHTRLIGLAMLVGVAAAAGVTPSKARDCLRQFFDGAGYGFASIVSLIVTAQCFGTAMEAAGVARDLGRLITTWPESLFPLAVLVPMAFALLCGSGMASTQSLYGFFQHPAASRGIDPVDLGAVVAIGSAAGRTMSPVAAVTLLCAQLSQTPAPVLARRVAGPLLVGAVVVVFCRSVGGL
jgi:DcuC family C4-dicarboxylate transporter